MAEEAQKTAQQQSLEVVAEEVVAITDLLHAEKAATKEPPPVPETEEPIKSRPADGPVEMEVSKPAAANEKIPEAVSFKEESTKVADLPDFQKKALEELKHLVQEALNKHELSNAAPKEPKLLATEVEKKPTEETLPPPAVEEPTKPGPEVVEITKDDTSKPEPPVESAEPEAAQAVVPEVIEEQPAAAVVDDDGAKTVEAIEETIVAVSNLFPPEQPSPEKEQEKAFSSEVKAAEAEAKAPRPPEEAFIWGIKLMEDERSDVVLLKFLRARDFKVKDAFAMIKNTLLWRKEFGIDQLLEEDLGNDLDKVVFMHGHSKEGHPVCYNVYGQFQNKEVYQKTFSDEEKRQKFLRWRIQFLEKSIRKLDFSPGGISTIVQVNDLKNSPGPGKWELRQATKQALQLLQDNYPEFAAKQVFINVPWWYLAVNRMISPFLTQRTKSKFVFAGPSKSAETLFRYIAAEQVPVHYGGLSKDGDFGTADIVTEITVKPSAKHTVEFPVAQICLLTWEVRVVGWDVSYCAEFVPSAEDGYTVIIQKARKVASTEEPVICNSFRIGEPGKVVFTIDNPTSKKKMLMYRLKTKPSVD